MVDADVLLFVVEVFEGGFGAGGVSFEEYAVSEDGGAVEEGYVAGLGLMGGEFEEGVGFVSGFDLQECEVVASVDGDEFGGIAFAG